MITRKKFQIKVKNMTRDEIYKRVQEYASGFLTLTEIGPEIKRDNGYIWYKCPCGGKDHYGGRVLQLVKSEWVSGFVVNCFIHNRVYHIKDEPNRIANIIRQEEESFNKLMDKFEKLGILGKSVTAKEAFRLYTEQGCPVEMLEVDDMKEYDKLFEEHRSKS